MNLTGLLTRKLGPLPTWAYLVGVAGLGFLAYRMGWFGQGRGQTAATGPAPSQPALTPLQEAGLLQQLAQLPQTQSGPAPAPVAPSTAASQQQIGKGWGTIGLPNVVQSQGQSYAQTNQPYSSLLAAGQGSRVFFQAAPGVFLPVTYDVASSNAAAGAPLFVQQAIGGPDGVGGDDAGGAGVGGPKAPRPVRHSLIGGRGRVGATEHMWRPGHPLLRSGDQLHPHFALGGGGTVVHAAAATGLHPARLLALNPHLRAGRAQGNQYLRVR